MKPLLFILSGIFSLSAWSYSIPNHHQLTKLSGELLKACKLNYKLNLQEVIDYSGLEDSDPHEGNIGTRLANWHFYHGHDEKDVWFVKGVIRKTFHTRWKKMETRQTEVIGNRNQTKKKRNEWRCMTAMLAEP